MVIGIQNDILSIGRLRMLNSYASNAVHSICDFVLHFCPEIRQHNRFTAKNLHSTALEQGLSHSLHSSCAHIHTVVTAFFLLSVSFSHKVCALHCCSQRDEFNEANWVLLLLLLPLLRVYIVQSQGKQPVERQTIRLNEYA